MSQITSEGEYETSVCSWAHMPSPGLKTSSSKMENFKTVMLKNQDNIVVSGRHYSLS